MPTAAIIAIVIVAAAIIIILNNVIVRLLYEKRYRRWQEEHSLEWQAALEQARKSAINQSRAVLGGKFAEQMAPFFPGFRYDPTEVRFIGSPVDMVAFPGLAAGDPQEIVILEVKSGRDPQLTSAQRKIRGLIENGMVRWDEVHCTVE